METEPEVQILVGANLPWHVIDRAFLLVEGFTPYSKFVGDKVVGNRLFGAYGVIRARVPNPDADRELQSIRVPVMNVSDFKSISRAHLDRGVQDGSNELVILYLQRRSLFGKKPSILVAAFPAGTWEGFYEAVSNYKPQEFEWPQALFLYQPFPAGPFKSAGNLFRK